MTFKEFRESRYLSQVECAMLLNVSRPWVRYHETRPLTKYWAECIETALACGPYSFIKPRYFTAPRKGEASRPLPAVVRRRLPPGSCYLSLEYYHPDTLEIAQSRKDLIAKIKKYPSIRWFILRRIIATHKAGVQVIGVALPKWPKPTY